MKHGVLRISQGRSLFEIKEDPCLYGLGLGFQACVELLQLLEPWGAFDCCCQMFAENLARRESDMGVSQN